jgi:ribosome biogenesis GTPase / thiamine phosphate phosphatase
MSRDPWRSRERPTNLPGEAFLCAYCGATVPGEAAGTRQRNHCPRCLRSLHVDVTVGDRRSLCRGTMDPISLWIRQDGELALLHRCRRCGTIRSNRVAGDDAPEALRDLLEGLLQAGSCRVRHGP